MDLHKISLEKDDLNYLGRFENHGTTTTSKTKADSAIPCFNHRRELHRHVIIVNNIIFGDTGTLWACDRAALKLIVSWLRSLASIWDLVSDLVRRYLIISK